MNKPLQNEVMSADEAALYLDIPKPRLLKLVREGQIPGVKVGRSWKFSFSVLEKWQDSKKKSPSDRALNISNPLNRSETTTPSNKDLLKEKTNKSNNTNPHIPPNATLVNPQNYSNPNLEAQNNTQNKTPQIIVNSVILWGGIGIYAIYFSKSHPNAGFWDSLFDIWSWVVLVILGVIQAIVNAVFFKNKQL
jgi:excisionase family DNA binding protein